MTPNLTALYYSFYETYSKKYGQNTCILVLVGKFYELYDYIDSATGQPRTSMRRAIELMNIAMKEKPAHGPKGEMGLWSGFPEQSLHKFAQTLTREGWVVVVVDQVKDITGGQVIDRVPTRILSPGTHVETATQERMTVAAIWIEDKFFAASVLDLTTGEVFSYETQKSDEILHMLQVYSVKEVIFTEVKEETSLASLKSMFGIHGVLHSVPYNSSENFQNSFPREEFLRKMFRLKTMMPVRTFLQLGENNRRIERALCLLLRFVEDHFPTQASRLTSHELYSPSVYMRLSNNILEQLNILTFQSQKSILSILERTHSAIGKRAMRERVLRPITQEEELTRRWAQVAYFTKNPESQKVLEKICKSLYDLPRLHYKFASGSLESTDILQMFQSYSGSMCMIQNLKSTPLESSKNLEQKIQEFRSQVETLLSEEKAQKRDQGELVGFLTASAGPKTLALEERIDTCVKEWMIVWKKFCIDAKIPVDSFHLEKSTSGEYSWEGPRTHLKSLKAEAFLKKQNLSLLEIESKKSGPITLTCKEFTEFSMSLVRLENLLNASLKQETQVVCDTLWESVRVFQNEWIEWIGRVDCSVTMSAVSKEQKWVQPSLGTHLHIEGLRHPLLESAQTRVEYVKHNVILGKEENARGWLIYGVNASGKSSLMKATGIAVILAQAGCFVPADSMSLRPYDSAFSRIWTHDNVWAGLSSFAVEIAELRDILMTATHKSLVLGDEVCSGTESMSATALVASTLEHLNDVGAHFIFATHLHDLMKVPGFMPRRGIDVWHLRVERTPDGKLIYDRTLQAGSGSCSYGLEVARAMGIPLALLDRAHEIRRALAGETTSASAPRSSWNAAIQRNSCEMCGSAVVRDLEVHHITQRSEGGDNSLRNLAVLCESCHDRHHAGELEVGPLVMTTDGPERVSMLSTSSVGRRARIMDLFTAEEQMSIRSELQRFQGRPLQRTSLALEEQGIRITVGQLQSFTR